MEAKTNNLATDYEFLLMDRIQKIKSINELYDLEHNAYVSFSGGKDSTVLSHLIDEALPGNHIPRVFLLKKEPARRFEKESGRPIAITGMTREEKGQRTTISCIIADEKTGGIKRFHPLSVITADNLGFLDWYIKTRNIELCELYYPPYSFQRTGCKGCPFSQDLQEQLDTMAVLMPEEKKQCELIWKPVYDEYRRIGYRLHKEDGQQSLFEK